MQQNGEIDTSTQSYLSDKTCRTSVLHATKNTQTWYTPPGSPIISANETPTEKISQFVDHFLISPTQKLRFFVKDRAQILQILDNIGNLPPKCILVTLDVSSLYTNIPNDEGIAAARDTLYRSRPGH